MDAWHIIVVAVILPALIVSSFFGKPSRFDSVLGCSLLRNAQYITRRPGNEKNLTRCATGCIKWCQGLYARITLKRRLCSFLLGTRKKEGKKVANRLTCFDVADYFLSLADEDAGDLIPHLKLQKLVYYAQGFHLTLYKEPLFNETIEAWMHGPVIPELYRKYKKHGDGFIPKPQSLNMNKYRGKVRELLDEVYRVLGQFSAWKLRSVTHEEPPWKNAYKQGDGTPISHEDLANYFKAYIQEA